MTLPLRTIPSNPAGLDAMRYVVSRAHSRSLLDAQELARRHCSDRPIVIAALDPGHVQKAAVPAATTSNAQGPILQDSVATDFFLSFQSPGGGAWARALPLFEAQPWNKPRHRDLTSSGGDWVKEGFPAPISGGTYDLGLSLPFRHIMAGEVLTREELRFVRVSLQGTLDKLRRRVNVLADSAMWDPSNSGDAGRKPASLTSYGVVVSSAGDSAANAFTNLENLIAANTTGLIRPFLVINTQTAFTLFALLGSLGYQASASNVFGFECLISSSVKQGLIVLVDGAGVGAAWDPAIELNVANEGALQMSDAPTMEGVTPTATTAVSLWQTGLVVVTADLALNFAPIKLEVGSPSQSGAIVYTQVGY